MKKIRIIVIILSLFLTGCYDKKELNKIAIVTATEINKINEEYKVSVQIVNPKLPEDSGSERAYVNYTGYGVTIQQAYRDIKLSSPRYLYPEHLQVLIIDEDIAKNDITEILDFYLRSPSVRGEFYILISKDNDILDITTELVKLPSASIVNTIDTNNKYQGVANLITLNELASDSINPNKEIVVPSIEKNNDTYRLSGLAIFKDNKLIDYLTNDESITYNIIKNNTNSNILTYECNDNKYLTVELIKGSSIIKPKNNKIDIGVKLDVALNEYNCSGNLSKEEDIKKLKIELEKYLDKRFINDINNIRYKYNADVFGFLDEIYKHDYKTYINVYDKWDQYMYRDILINIKTEVNIIGKGKLMEGLNEED